MRSLKMSTSLPDATSRVGKLTADMDKIPRHHTMERIMRETEQKKLGQYMVDALATADFKWRIEQRLAQEKNKAYKKIVVRFRKWMLEQLQGYIQWGPDTLTAELPAAMTRQGGGGRNQHQPRPGNEQRQAGGRGGGGSDGGQRGRQQTVQAAAVPQAR
jgi:hypothetical protein